MLFFLFSFLANCTISETPKKTRKELLVAAEAKGGGDGVEMEVVLQVVLIDEDEVLLALNGVLGRLPEDADGYLSYLLSRRPQPAVSQFKHFIYGLKSYLHVMGYPDLAGRALPKIRREKRLPRVLSVEQVQQLLRFREMDAYFGVTDGIDDIANTAQPNTYNTAVYNLHGQHINSSANTTDILFKRTPDDSRIIIGRTTK